MDCHGRRARLAAPHRDRIGDPRRVGCESRDPVTLIEHTWRQVQKATSLSAVIIATDNQLIFDEAKGFGAEVMMTSSDIQSGSDRVAAAAKAFTAFTPDIVVNIQGYEPLMPAAAIDDTALALAEEIRNGGPAVVSTPATPFPAGQDYTLPSLVKVITDQKGYAIYFSRSVIPYPRDTFTAFVKHLGLYAFRADFLQTYVTLPQTPLEKAEKLEQLRVMEHGYRIKVVTGSYPTLEVNTPEEYAAVKAFIEKGESLKS